MICDKQKERRVFLSSRLHFLYPCTRSKKNAHVASPFSPLFFGHYWFSPIDPIVLFSGIFFRGESRE